MSNQNIFVCICFILLVLLAPNISLSQEQSEKGVVAEEGSKYTSDMKNEIYKEMQNMVSLAVKLVNVSSWFLYAFMAIGTLVGCIVGYNVYRDRKEYNSWKKQAKINVDKIAEDRESIKEIKLNFENYYKALFPLLEAQQYYDQRNYEKAIEKYKEAFEYDPDAQKIYVRLNKLLMENGEADEAIVNLLKLNDKKPNNIDVLVLLSKAYRRKEQYEDAKEQIIKALKINSTYGPAAYEFGIISLYNDRDFKKAEEMFFISIDYYDKNEGYTAHWIYSSLAVAQKLNGNLNEFVSIIKSDDILNEKLQKNGGSPLYWGYLGLNRYILGDEDTAIECFETAKEYKLQSEIAKSIMKRVDLLYEAASSDDVGVNNRNGYTKDGYEKIAGFLSQQALSEAN
ncbi:MAG: tetratricopeptide repeat protein [Gammaproteobacteria bacterium]|nr:tetratricopeptide repeat protein [Gammaproteobacteria bacterium]